MSVQINGEFLTINENITVKITEIISIKPVSMVIVQPNTGRIVSRDFPKIIISTNREDLEILYTTDEERDIALSEIRKILAENSTKQNYMKEEKAININVSDSSNINIVSQSNNVEINQEIRSDANSLIKEFIEKLEKDKEIDNEIKQEILECITDIKENIDKGKTPPKYGLKALLSLTSDIASLSSLGISIAQLFGI